MPQKYLSTGLTLLIDALAIAAVAAILALLYWAATGAGGSYLGILSNILFLAGGIFLAFGALIEFFHLEGTKEIRRMLFISQALLGRYAFLDTADKDEEDRPIGTGWALIVLGAILITFSIVASFDYLI